jgi:acetyl esterase/lipase
MRTVAKYWRKAWLGALVAAALACARGGQAPATTTVAPPAASETPAATLATAATTAPADTAVPAASATKAPEPATAEPAADLQALEGSIANDVTYCTSGDGVELKMDVYYPDSLDEPVPAVVFIHGGGWSSGDKRQGAELFTTLVHSNFLVVSLNYRLAPQFPYPAQIQDVKCAVRHLRANAAAYGLDPDRIGAMGTSAGAHLAAMLGLTDATEAWDTGAYLDQSSKVAAVVDFFGPMDLSQEFPGIASALGEQVFGATSASDQVLVEASPVTYITPDDPPFLIIHGAADEFVPPSQSQILYDRLTAAGVPAELVLVEGGRHAFIAEAYPVRPSRVEIAARVAAFFREHLK